nr:zonular occludens toxin domain-containing protein [uncultured Deefgea sp.]
MITIITGIPGAGKTLHALWLIKKMAESEGRDVYYNGITDLNLPWIEFTDATKWHELPVGAIIVMDECQRTYRMRANGSTVPEHVAMLETHRHKGYDLFLITQHPMLIDGNVRRLVGRHIHVVRRFGGQSAVVHEWNAVNEQCGKSRKDSQNYVWSYPKEFFDYYKSAEKHTHKRMIPKSIYFLFAAPFLLAILGYFFYGFVQSKINPKGVQPEATAQAMPPGYQSGNSNRIKKLTTSEWVEEQQPRIPGMPHTAPVYDDLAKPQSVPAPQACVQMADKCKCYTDQATPIEVTDDMCKNIVKNGIYLPHLKREPTQDELKRRYDAERLRPEVS